MGSNFNRCFNHRPRRFTGKQRQFFLGLEIGDIIFSILETKIGEKMRFNIDNSIFNLQTMGGGDERLPFFIVLKIVNEH